MLIINTQNDPQSIFDKHYSLTCPHCSTFANITAISIPRYEYLSRFQPDSVGIAYRCDSCNHPIFLRFSVDKYELGNNRIFISDEFTEIERAKETFEFAYLPESVEEDFREALECFSNACFNAFAAMCRRTVQSVCSQLGAKGKDKVMNQLKDLKDMAEIDDETYDILRQIIIDGHDGSHPHLPSLSSSRAGVLLELMKDVLYQLYVRKGKLQEAMKLRNVVIQEMNEESG